MRRSLIALAVAAGFAVPASAANLVTNGSFETGLSGWIIGGVDLQGYPPVAITYGAAAPYPTGAFGEAVPANNALTNSPDAVGGHAAYFVSDITVNQSLSQTVFLTPGIYQIGFSAYAPANGYGNAVEATFSGTIAGIVLANYAVSTGPVTTWQTFMGATNIVAAGNYVVEFVFNTNGFPAKDVVIDQVYIIAGNPPIGVPAPAALALFGLGIAGLGFVQLRGRAAA